MKRLDPKPVCSANFVSFQLRDYVKYAFKNNRMAISASGVGHDELITHAANNFKLDFSHWEPVKADFEECLPAKGSLDLQSYYHPEYALDTHPQDSSANYSGGEYFENTLDYLAYVAVAVEGAGINKPKDLLSFALLQQVWTSRSGSFSKIWRCSLRYKVTLQCFGTSRNVPSSVENTRRGMPVGRLIRCQANSV